MWNVCDLLKRSMEWVCMKTMADQSKQCLQADGTLMPAAIRRLFSSRPKSVTTTIICCGKPIACRASVILLHTSLCRW